MISGTASRPLKKEINIPLTGSAREIYFTLYNRGCLNNKAIKCQEDVITLIDSKIKK